jgi:hypothetical protein
MPRSAEIFTVTSGDDDLVIANDVGGSAPGVSREIILHPGWAPQIQRNCQKCEYITPPVTRVLGTGNAVQRFELIVARYFSSLGAAIEFKATHESTIPRIGGLVLSYSYGGLQLVSLGAFENVNINPGASFAIRVVTHYQWCGTPFVEPEAE